MVVKLPDPDTFVEEARRAGAVTVYAATLLSAFVRRSNGLSMIRARFAATAVGELACGPGGPERVLLTWEHDFGSAVDVLDEGRKYRVKVEDFAAEARDKLAAGFEVRTGVITAL